jgi:hypothetical protein
MKRLVISFVSCLFMISCEKEGPQGPTGKDGVTDKQIRFDLGWSFGNSYESDTVIYAISSGMGISQFNFNNYPDIDSVVFILYNIKTMTRNVEDISASVKIDLYDLTNKEPIPNSEIISDDIPMGSFVQSKNLVNSFPDQTIDLGIRVIFDVNNFVETGPGYLFLYRK